MDFNFSLFLMALGLACCIEALLWLVSPSGMRDMVLKLAEQPADRLRMCGFLLLAFGLGVCALGRSLM
ncbi:MAG: DUF2065 domain-containing protein [Mailhella sp.]|jgi:uncharacterized protein YjeT (DUF2065 family)|nr:DUF2065 domain-containing protein [Mailhella sp.]